MTKSRFFDATSTQRTCSLVPAQHVDPTRCDPLIDPRLSMSDDRGRDMMTSHLEKGKTLRHPAHSGQRKPGARAPACQVPRFTLPHLQAVLTILVPSTGREPPDQRLADYKNNAGVKVAPALQSRTPEGRTRTARTACPPFRLYPFPPDGHSDDPHENVP